MKNQPLASMQDAIVVVRGQRVVLDATLAELYGVSTKHLNQAVRRNLARFPADFVFELTNHEVTFLRSQIVTSNKGRGGRRTLPYAFTEHGAIMAATILNTARAIDMSVYVVRAFVKFREILAGHAELSKRLDELERRIDQRVGDQDIAIASILSAIRKLAASPPPASRPIGFVITKKGNG